jgi:O-antigen ligase
MVQFQGVMVPVYLALCLLLGGASSGGYWANMLLQLLALPLILMALLRHRPAPLATPARDLQAIALLTIAMIAFQLIPLPPSIWPHLPGREQIADGFAMLGQPLQWLPVSLAPHATIASSFWLLPALAILIAQLRLGGFRRRWIAGTIIGVTAAGVVLGTLQVLGGGDSGWYFYSVTNIGAGTGFFANSNHMGTLLVVSLPFLGALFVEALRRGASLHRSSGMLLILAGLTLVVVVGVFVNGSLAAFGLSIPAIAATVLMILNSRKKRLPRWILPLLGLAAVASVAAVFSAPFGNDLTSQEASTQNESRYTAFIRTAAAAGDFFPTGSGIGTFQQIYPMYEDPAAVTRLYMNHAHNDYVQLALEAGLPAMLLILLFLFWWSKRVFHIWSMERPSPFAQAATIATGVILAHSIVDYPLRTAALSALFAVCCGLMADLREASKASRDGKARKGRHLEA